MKKLLFTTIVFGLTCLIANAQSSKEKAAQLAAEFNKSKHKEKSKNGVHVKVDVEVEAKPDIRSNVSDYAGTYGIVGMNQYFRLSQNDKGWAGEFFQRESDKETGSVKLKDIRIDGGLLTGTIYNIDGTAKPFEAVFINKFESGQIRSTGMGIKQVLSLSNGFVVDKAYFERVE